MTDSCPKVSVRTTQAQDFDGIIEMCKMVYPDAAPWRMDQLESHLRVFPEGQFVAVEEATKKVVGMAASLIIRWDAYNFRGHWRDFTAHGMFTNHDPKRGHTLYGAEVMVRPRRQGLGIGSKLYAARFELVRRLGLRRIRAAARLRGYHRYANQMSAEDYVIGVAEQRWKDPTLSFQIKHGFEVVGVVPKYLLNDPESLGYAVVIEWLNPSVATAADKAKRDPRFRGISYPTRK